MLKNVKKLKKGSVLNIAEFFNFLIQTNIT